MADEFTDVSYTGWGSRIMGSFTGALIGFVVFVISFPVLFWNEGRAVHTAKDLAEGKGSVVSLSDASKVDSGSDGKLVHLTGMADTQEQLKDDKFDVSATAIRLVRAVEMYQWKQSQKKETRKKLGGGQETVTKTTYKKDWSPEAISSDSFKYPEGHRNPPMPYHGQNWTAQKVTLGVYTLPPDLVKQMRDEETIPTTEALLAGVPENLRSKLQLRDGYLCQAATPATDGKTPTSTPTSAGGDFDEEPSSSAWNVGDVRVQFKVVKPATVSIVARLHGNSFEPYQAKSGTTIDRLMMGNQSATAMFEQLESENEALTWILRVVGFLAMAIGMGLVLRPFVVIADVIPIVGDIMGAGFAIAAVGLAIPLTLLTIAVGWVSYRPLVGIPLMVLAVGALVGVFILGRRRRAAKAA